MATLRISMIQFRSVLGDIEKNFESASRLIDRALVDAPDVIVLPELWSTGFYPTPLADFADVDGGRTLDFLSVVARRSRVNIIGGTVIVRKGDQFFNRSNVIDRDGELRAEYDKIHLFSMSGEDAVFTAGDSIVTFSIDGVKCSIIVCYDVRFPELSRRLALEGVELLFIPAAWPLRRLDHWRILNTARAIENQLFVIAVNGFGHSMLIDPWGIILIEGERDEQILSTIIDTDAIKNVRSTINVFADRNPSIDRI